MIPLESPVPEIGPPGSESGERKRTHGTRPAARLRKRRISHRPPTGYAPLLDSTQPAPRPGPGSRGGRTARLPWHHWRRGAGPGRSGHLNAVPDDRRLSTAVAAACFRGPPRQRAEPGRGTDGEPGRRPRPPATSSVVGVESLADVAAATNVRPCPLPRRKPPDRDAGRAALAEAALPFGRRESHESYL